MAQPPLDLTIKVFEDPGDAATQSHCIISKAIVEAVGLWDRAVPGGGPTWQRVKDLTRADLFALAAFVKPPPDPPVSADFWNLKVEDMMKIAQAVAAHNGLKYPQDTYGVCCCCT